MTLMQVIVAAANFVFIVAFFMAIAGMMSDDRSRVSPDLECQGCGSWLTERGGVCPQQVSPECEGSVEC